MSGLKTLLWGLLLAVVVPALTFLGGVDWTQYVSPTIAPMIVGAITIILRAITTGPMAGMK
jgi:hypothetical protein